MTIGEWKNALGLPLALLLCGVLFDAAAFAYPPLALTAANDLRMRLFRLARVAAIALPLLALFFSDLAGRAGTESATARRGGRAMVFGAVALPIVLIAAALTRLEIRLLLPLPAIAVFFAAASAASLARRHAGLLEFSGWRLIAASTAAGLVMGLYAFDTPFVPNFAGPYDGLFRALIRRAHEGAIVSGMALIVLSGALEKKGVAHENRTDRDRRRQIANA
jgi:hypothetical protein